MDAYRSALSETFALLASGDWRLWRVVALSIAVSGSATLLAAVLGLPAGAWLALARFRGRAAAVAVLDALMGLPPVVLGLLVYLLLSRAGPLGRLGLLFTPAAMILAQTLLVAPIIAALARQTVEAAWEEYGEQLRSLNCTRTQAAATLLWDTRVALVTAVLAGFGRAAAEVGAVMIVGGNIDGATRTMTTAIALETSKGDLPMALALGAVLLAMILAVNGLAQLLRRQALRRHG